MEARTARLESDVGHMRSDLADVKSDVRTLRDRIDTMNAKLSERIDHVGASLNAKALLLFVALAAGMYATMARGFGWL